MKINLKSLFFAFTFAIIAGAMFAPLIGVAAAPVIGMFAGASFIPQGTFGATQAGIFKEVWTGELVKRFTHKETFLDGVPDYSRYVGNAVIHLNEIGVHPNVLVDNTTYPLPVSARTDGDIAISLRKLDTEATEIHKDEVYALSYDKMKVTHELHRESLQMKSADLAIHSFAPNANTINTPVIITTGTDNGLGFKRLVPSDLIKLKKQFDDLKIPKANRRLVLCNQHVSDLLELKGNFERQYNNIREGEVLKMYGFEIREYPEMPLYDITNTKKAFGAAAAGTDREASVAFYTKRMFKAKSNMEVEYTPRDARNKKEEVSMDMRFIAMPKTLVGTGAVVSVPI